MAMDVSKIFFVVILAISIFRDCEAAVPFGDCKITNLTVESCNGIAKKTVGEFINPYTYQDKDGNWIMAGNFTIHKDCGPLKMRLKIFTFLDGKFTQIWTLNSKFSCELSGLEPIFSTYTLLNFKTCTFKKGSELVAMNMNKALVAQLNGKFFYGKFKYYGSHYTSDGNVMCVKGYMATGPKNEETKENN